jgi:replicative DNA helicase
MISLHSAVTQTIEVVSQRALLGGVDIVGLSSGFSILDDVTLGFRKNAIYFFAGRPGMGKTSFALTVARHIAKKNKILFLSLEMSAELLALRTLSGATGIAQNKIERGRLTKDELLKVQGVVTDIQGLTFDLIDSMIDSTKFRDTVLQYQQQHGLDMLFIDYISLFTDDIRVNENERLTRIMRNLKQIASDCNIPIVVLAQLNREVEKREGHIPIPSDLRDSGSLEQDAFLIAFLLRPYYYEMLFNGQPPLLVEEDAKIIISKNRQGEIGQFSVHFHPQQMMWSDIKLGEQPRVQ